MVRTCRFVTFVWASWLPLMFAVAVAQEQAGACEPERCGNVTVSPPFGIVWSAEENGCAQPGFQVHCTGDIPYLGYKEPDYNLRILDIFYANASLRVSDVHKLGILNASSCHIPTTDSSWKVAAPFSIVGSNWNLGFYNCSRKPARRRAGLVETVCRNNTYETACRIP